MRQLVELIDESRVRLEQHVCIVPLHKAEHFDKVLVVVERRQRPALLNRNPVCLVIGHAAKSYQNAGSLPASNPGPGHVRQVLEH